MDGAQFVIFKIEGEDFGVEITNVLEIIRPQQILKVPNAPKHIEGIINLRGKVHPIFNLRRMFHLGHREFDDSTKIIIVKVNEMSVGFIVDDVSEILRVEDKNIEETPGIITGHHRKYIKSVGKVDDRMVIILDLNMILSEQDKHDIKEYVKLRHPHTEHNE